MQEPVHLYTDMLRERGLAVSVSLSLSLSWRKSFLYTTIGFRCSLRALTEEKKSEDILKMRCVERNGLGRECPLLETSNINSHRTMVWETRTSFIKFPSAMKDH